MKQRLIWFNLQRDGTRNGLSNIKKTFEAINVSSAPTFEHFPVFNAGLSQVHMMAGQNVKKKYLMCQVPIKMLKQQATPNSSLHNLKIYTSKGCRKTSQIWIYVASNVATYLANTVVLNIQIWGRCHFRL